MIFEIIMSVRQIPTSRRGVGFGAHRPETYPRGPRNSADTRLRDLFPKSHKETETARRPSSLGFPLRDVVNGPLAALVIHWPFFRESKAGLFKI